MSDQYDVIMIGAGPSAIFCAYELKRNKPDMKVLMIEKGRRIERRACPKRNTKVCVGCKPCSITTGFAGAGAFSDGKLSLSPDVGGNLPEILGYDRTIELLKESDDIYLKFGADTKASALWLPLRHHILLLLSNHSHTTVHIDVDQNHAGIYWKHKDPA